MKDQESGHWFKKHRELLDQWSTKIPAFPLDMYNLRKRNKLQRVAWPVFYCSIAILLYCYIYDPKFETVRADSTIHWLGTPYNEMRHETKIVCIQIMTGCVTCVEASSPSLASCGVAVNESVAIESESPTHIRTFNFTARPILAKNLSWTRNIHWPSKLGMQQK
jgi:hypothetical protein